MKALVPPVSVLADAAPGVVLAAPALAPTAAVPVFAPTPVAPLPVPLVGALPVTFVPDVPPRLLVGPPKPPGLPDPPRPADVEAELSVPLKPEVVPGFAKFTMLVLARSTGVWV
jgi:hypothetical protein